MRSERETVGAAIVKRYRRGVRIIDLMHSYGWPYERLIDLLNRTGVKRRV